MVTVNQKVIYLSLIRSEEDLRYLKILLASMSAKQKLQYFSKCEINHREGCMTIIKP